MHCNWELNQPNEENKTLMKDLSLTSIRKSVRNALNSDDVVPTFNIFCYRTEDMVTRVLKVLINVYCNDEGNPDIYVVVVADLLAGVSESFICDTKKTKDPAQVISNRITDMVYNMLWDNMHWLDYQIALYATIVDEKYSLGLQWYVAQAEKLTGTTYQDAPSYVQSKLVRKAIQLLYIRDNENLSSNELESRIDDYLDMKKIAEN